MRLVFLGSSGFACPCLERILDDGVDELVGVITQPDRPKGRNLALAACPAKAFLAGRRIPVMTPERVNAPESLAAIAALAPELLVVVAYGQLLKRPLLEIAPRGCINVHGSLLPKYRGAAPIQWALACGEAVTGVTTMHVNERLDAGDMILKQEVAIEPADTGGSLHDKLALAGAQTLARTLDLIRSGQAPRTPQDDAAATLAPKLKKTDGALDWALPAPVLHNRVRAFNPWPCCYCRCPGAGDGLLRVLASRVEPGGGAEPGVVLAGGDEGLLVQAGGGQALRLLEVQPEGRKPMSGGAFLRGRAVPPGTKLD